MTIRRISEKEIRRSIAPLGEELEAAPSYLPPILRAAWAWRFTRDIVKKFMKELTEDRSKDFIKKLGRKF